MGQGATTCGEQLLNGLRERDHADVDVKVRPAAEHDVAALVELRRENGRWHVGLDPVRHRVPESGPVGRYFREVLAGQMPGVHVLVAEVHGEVAGMSELVVSQSHGDHQIGSERRTAQVHTVIDPEHRSVGVGSALVTAIKNLAEHLAIEELVAPVLLANTGAAEFYASHGFAAYGQLLGIQLHTPERR